MTKLRLPLLLAGLVLAGTLSARQSVAQSVPAATSRPVVTMPVGRPMDPNVTRYWSDPNQLRLKEAVGAADEEWQVLLPKIVRVQKLGSQQRRRMGGGYITIPLGMGGAGGAANEPTEVEKAEKEMDRVLADKSAKPEEDIKPALQELRAAKAKAKAELDKARKDLRDVTTARQEAALRQEGLLD